MSRSPFFKLLPHTHTNTHTPPLIPPVNIANFKLINSSVPTSRTEPYRAYPMQSVPNANRTHFCIALPKTFANAYLNHCTHFRTSWRRCQCKRCFTRTHTRTQRDTHTHPYFSSCCVNSCSFGSAALRMPSAFSFGFGSQSQLLLLSVSFSVSVVHCLAPTTVRNAAAAAAAAAVDDAINARAFLT